jgi:hypothetical protein
VTLARRRCGLPDLYWSVGRDITQKRETVGWGAKVIQRLSADVRREFPGQTG